MSCKYCTGWEEYLNKLVEDKEIQDVPENFCW